jgi:hypothetical protein
MDRSEFTTSTKYTRSSTSAGFDEMEISTLRFAFNHLRRGPAALARPVVFSGYARTIVRHSSSSCFVYSRMQGLLDGVASASRASLTANLNKMKENQEWLPEGLCRSGHSTSIVQVHLVGYQLPATL